jgi:soluble lytic murein transglycosylase-like protein
MRGIARISRKTRILAPVLAIAFAAGAVGRGLAADGAEGRVAEHVTLTNGFDLICDHREQTGDRVRLYTEADNSNFVEVGAADVASVETIVLPAAALPPSATAKLTSATHAELTKAELHELLSSAGVQHNLDVNLLVSVVRAESGGHTAAVSRKGAQGLMQLMPKTAAQLGVNDSLRPEENVAGGASYLDSLLTRYHDNLALALAAYNAGPAAVDRWHGVPPYRETRLYVARIIRDFNASVRNASRNASLDAAKLSHPDPQLKNIVAQASHQQVSLAGATAP